jgi:hypothetical protein
MQNKNLIRRQKYYRKTFWQRIVKKILRLINYSKLEYSRDYYKKNREHLCKQARERHLKKVLRELNEMEKNISLY